MAKIILLDENVAIPLPLLDKYNKDVHGNATPFALNPTGECSDTCAKALTDTYKLKYAIFDESNEDHKRLVKSGKYPEAKGVVDNKLKIGFDALTKEQKDEVLAFIDKLTNSKEQATPNA